MLPSLRIGETGRTLKNAAVKKRPAGSAALFSLTGTAWTPETGESVGRRKGVRKNGEEARHSPCPYHGFRSRCFPYPENASPQWTLLTQGGKGLP